MRLRRGDGGGESGVKRRVKLFLGIAAQPVIPRKARGGKERLNKKNDRVLQIDGGARGYGRAVSRHVVRLGGPRGGGCEIRDLAL